jgi:serine/threonine protein kinase
MVFVCSANEDEAVAQAIRASLEGSGLKCSPPNRDAPLGQSFASRVIETIRESKLFLLILSQRANRSPEVRQQLESAAHFQLPLVTFRIEPIEPADELSYFLWKKHFVDGFEGPLDRNIPNLLRQIATLTKPEEKGQAPPSETFANFRILRKPDGSLFRLGQGGMGVTYKAVDTTLDRPVALKLIAADLLKSSKARQRFLREAKAAAKIVHPHVATVFQFGEEGDAYFYAMEFLEGEDLERYVDRQGPLSPKAALRVAYQVAQALEAAQSRQLIHRDIKPGNIMTRGTRAGDPEVKLIDFGLARLTEGSDSDAGQITHSQDFVGSPAFASPEQCEMHGTLDTRSDIYSLGITLWYLLLGKLPFVGTVGQLLVAHAVKAPPWNELEHLPEAVVALLRQMLAKDPAERPQTPSELQEAIEKIMAGLTNQSALPEGQARSTGSGQARPTSASRPSPSELTLVPPHSPGSGRVQTGAPRPSQSDSYSQVGVGSFLAERYRIREEIREGIGGRVFLVKDEKATGRQPGHVALKLLHPTIASDPTLLDRLENEVGTIRSAMDPHLLRYFAFDREASPPFLIREWVHGFLLYDLLRWRRACRIAEVIKLLEPIASTLDFVASHGLSLVDVSARKIFVACPGDMEAGTFSNIGRLNIEDWDRCEVKLNPLSLGPLILRNRPLRDNQTLIPSSRILSLSQAESGIRGSKAVRLLGRLVYELVGGHPPSDAGTPSRYTPLSALNEAGNRALQRACSDSDQGYADCEEFWRMFRESGETSRVSSASPHPSRTPEARSSGTARSDVEPAERVMVPPRLPEVNLPPSPVPITNLPVPSREVRVSQPPPLPASLPPAIEPPETTRNSISSATKERPWENSLGMKFVPVAGVLFSIWDTRFQDYEQFAQQSGYPVSEKSREPGFKQGPDHPVVNVSWTDATAFCGWLTERERSLGLLPDRMIYRLPTDLEWSTAVGLGNEAGNSPEQKKGKIKVYPWGLGWPPPPGSGNYCGEENKTGRSSWPVITGYNDGYARTSPVTAFSPNRYGLFDMGGNVWQWCEDWHNSSKFHRVLRGASWLNEYPDDLLLSNRRDDSPGSRRDNYGFRCVIA